MPPPSPQTTRAVIFANGELADSQAALALLRPDDWLIAADGGARHLDRLGLRPHLIVGDLDSLDPGAFAAYGLDGVPVERYSPRKDQTDLELAVRVAVANDLRDIVILGALGGRWDHTLANLLLPAMPGLAAVRIRIVDGRQQIYLVRGVAIVEGQPGDTVSLMPLGGDARGIVTEGLEYPLNDETLPFGTTRGISNVLLGPSALVKVKEGVLLCIVIAESHESLNR